MASRSSQPQLRALTLAEVAATVLLLVILVVALVLAMRYRARLVRAGRGRVACRSNLNQIAKGMATYLSECNGQTWWYPCPLGRGTRPDDYNGAEWLAALYWTKVLPEPAVFLCPGSDDGNDGGRDLGTHRAVAGLFGSRTVSYAAMHYHSLTDGSGKPTAGAIADDFPPNLPMASDDTQGSVNHGDAEIAAMQVLFFDSHVEFKSTPEIDPVRSVGQTGGLLWQLRN